MVKSDVQTVRFQHGGVTLCRFRCPADHDRWQRENVIVDGHNVAFAELPVEIRHAGHPGRLADSNLAVFYNLGDPYQRRMLHPDGDSANIFLFDSRHLLPALAPYAPEAEPERPLSIRFGRVWNRTYLKQRLLLARVAQRPMPSPAWVVEQAVEILDEVLAAGYGEPAATPAVPSRTQRRNSERVEEIKRLLFERRDRPVALEQVAEAVETSVFHMCRIFKRHTGQTVHGYGQRLRLRAALALVETTDVPLADIALEVGFAHQSHFTEAFRTAYGQPPGKLRRQLGRPRP